MAIKDSALEMQAISSEPEDSNTDSDWDDSEGDPDYDMLQETYSNFSNLSLRNKPKARVVEGKGLVGTETDPEVSEIIAPSLTEENFENVQKKIEGGLVERLKVDECKLYLRNNGLRLTGNKDTLIQRIKEHLELINGGGEKKYPPSSFVLNCKGLEIFIILSSRPSESEKNEFYAGDACTGDVVLFEQNVYEMFNIASRSASGPPCGKRIVAGRIVKESYGAAKQQHTFTIEVLWSKGEKPFPPLHPLLIKGRNLYRLKTLRQKWEDEGERHKILMEKHSRGYVAREHREARVQVKERRKALKENRVSKKDSVRNQCQSHSRMTTFQYQPQATDIPINPEKPAFPYQNSGLCANPRKETSAIVNKPAAAITEQCGKSFDSGKTSFPVHHIHNLQQQAWKRSPDYNRSAFIIDQFSRAELGANYNCPDFHSRGKPVCSVQTSFPAHHIHNLQQQAWNPHHRKPLESANIPLMPKREQKQLCRHYARGRCHFGDKCKFLHD